MAGNQALTAQVLHAGGHCGGDQDQAALHILEDARAFGSAVARMQRHQFGGSGPGIAQPDFGQSLAVLVEMGQKPTGGYGLELREPAATLDNGTLRLQLNWSEPPEDALVTQALTSPCLLLSLPRGDYQRVEAVDQHGQLRAADQR